MKVLIAVVMFLFGLFIGILVVPTFKEFSSSMYSEEEYSSDRINTILREFGINSLPEEASNINLFMKQDGDKKELWVRFHCSAEEKSSFVEGVSSRHIGRFNGDEPPVPKMHDGTSITWWAYKGASGKNEFSDLCVAYDEFARNVFLYAISDGERALPVPAASDSDSN